jgi:hypothetical protein
MKNVEQKIRRYKHSLELVRTIIPILVLILQAYIIGRIG